MGCSVSFFKELCHRIRRPKRDRWVRDDIRRPSSNVVSPKKRPHYGAIQKRIDPELIEDLVSQDLPRRLPDIRPESNIYEDMHRQMIGPLYSNCAVSFDSVASCSREGDEMIGHRTRVEKKNESLKHKLPSWLDSSGSNPWRDMEPILEIACEASQLASDVEIQVAKYEEEDRRVARYEEDDRRVARYDVETTDEEDNVCVMSRPSDDEIRNLMPGGRDYDSLQRHITEYRQKMAEAGGQPSSDDQLIEGDVQVTTSRYVVPVYTYESGDASWMKWC